MLIITSIIKNRLHQYTFSNYKNSFGYQKLRGEIEKNNSYFLFFQKYFSKQIALLGLNMKFHFPFVKMSKGRLK